LDQPESSFRDNVYAIVAGIPAGKVMTYGQIAALSGHPRAARQVGQIAHFGPSDLPWWRVVNKQGGLAGAYTNGGRTEHKRALVADGVVVDDEYKVKVGEILWWPVE